MTHCAHEPLDRAISRLETMRELVLWTLIALGGFSTAMAGA